MTSDEESIHIVKDYINENGGQSEEGDRVVTQSGIAQYI